MKVLYGGTFAPPHPGHYYIANILRFHFDDVVILPTPSNPWKPLEFPMETRNKLISIMFSDFYIDWHHYESGSPYLVDILDYLQERYKYLAFALGDDVFLQLDKFKDFKKILEFFKIYVVAIRNHTEEDVRKKQEELGIKEVLIIHSPFNLSSTLVRRLLKENQIQKIEEIYRVLRYHKWYTDFMYQLFSRHI